MKKLITLFLLTAVLIATTFASAVNIFSVVDETPITASIIYADSELQDGETLNIEADSKLDSEIAQATDEFTVQVNGNTSKAETIELSIEASSFKNEYDFDSQITPVPTATSGNAFLLADSIYTQSIELPSNVYTDTAVSTFTLNWNGKAALPNGVYTSTVTIEITNAN